MKKINIGIIGLGTVGAGLVELIKKNGPEMRRRQGIDLRIIAACDLRAGQGKKVGLPKATVFSRDYRRVLADERVDTVIELIGGLQPAEEIIKRTLASGRNLVTANKKVLAEKARSLLRDAMNASGFFGYRAAITGYFPLIEFLNRSQLQSRVIEGAYGIFNGTCNYILTRMERERCSYRQALTAAQEEGYAELDPYLDVSGMDTAHKTVLLVNLLYGYQMDMKQLYVEGIQKIDYRDISFAAELDYRIKLLAIVRKAGSRCQVRVHPCLVSRRSQLGALDKVMNGLELEDARGQVGGFIGPGAGKFPAAYAVLDDVITMACGNRYSYPKRQAGLTISGINEVESNFYVRFMALDKPGVLAAISSVLAKRHISIASVIQKEEEPGKAVPIVMLTHLARERDMRAALDEIYRLKVIKSPPLMIRVFDELPSLRG